MVPRVVTSRRVPAFPTAVAIRWWPVARVMAFFCRRYFVQLAAGKFTGTDWEAVRVNVTNCISHHIPSGRHGILARPGAR